MNLSELARTVFQAQLQNMQRTLEGCITGEDPIHLHDLRVANRRTRAALIEFKKLLPEEIYRRYEQEFRWIHQRTGPVRDLDVVLAQYQTLKRAIPKAWRPPLKPLWTLLESKRAAAQEVLVRDLQSRRMQEIFQTWSESLESGITGKGPRSLESAKDFGCQRIAKRYQGLRTPGQDLAKNTPPDHYHDFRILVKRLRYLMEFFSPVMDQDEFEQLRASLKTVQDTFGLFQDIEIQLLNLRILAGELYDRRAGADTMLAIGQMMGALESNLPLARKDCLKQSRWLISDSSARAFQVCFQNPVDLTPPG